MVKVKNWVIQNKFFVFLFSFLLYLIFSIGFVYFFLFSAQTFEIQALSLGLFMTLTFNLIIIFLLFWILLKNAQVRAVNEKNIASIHQTLMGGLSYTNENLTHNIQSIAKSNKTLESEIKNNFHKNITELSSLISLADRFSKWNISLPAFSGYAINPASLHQIVSLLEEKKPQHLVELGSGISTLAISAFLREQKRGKLISFEHDEQWFEITRQLLEEEKLEKSVSVLHSPLVPQRINNWQGLWFDIEQKHIPEFIDFLLIDSPPKSTGNKARFPAFDFFKKRLRKGSVVVVDDAGRKDESELVSYILSTGNFIKNDSLSSRTAFLEHI